MTTLLPLLFASSGWAARCPPGEVSSHVEQADIVFRGVVHDVHRSEGVTATIEFRTAAWWKGRATSEASVSAVIHPEWGLEKVDLGSEWIVFAKRGDEGVPSVACATARGPGACTTLSVVGRR